MASVAVLGAAGYAGAIAAQILHRHPGFELAHVTARAEAGQRLDDVHPRTRVPLELEVYEPDKHAVDAAVVAYPHGAAAPGRRRAALARHARRGSLRGLPAARPRHLRGLVRRAQGAGVLRAGRLRAARADARRRRRRGSRRESRLLSDGRAVGPRAARARRADRRRRDRREVRRVRRRALADADHALHRRHRERHAVQDRGSPPHAGDRAGARRARQRRDDHVHAAPAAARAGRARVLLRHADARAGAGGARRPLRRRVRPRAVRRAA